MNEIIHFAYIYEECLIRLTIAIKLEITVFPSIFSKICYSQHIVTQSVVATTTVASTAMAVEAVVTNNATFFSIAFRLKSRSEFVCVEKFATHSTH